MFSVFESAQEPYRQGHQHDKHERRPMCITQKTFPWLTNFPLSPVPGLPPDGAVLVVGVLVVAGVEAGGGVVEGAALPGKHLGKVVSKVSKSKTGV